MAAMPYRLVISAAILLAACAVRAQTTHQPELGQRSAPVLQQDGLKFKDLDRNGKLDPYEDWRLPPQARAADLLSRMSLDEVSGLLVHGSLPSVGPMGFIGVGKQYDFGAITQMVRDHHVTTFITRVDAPASSFAEQNNRTQEIAEDTKFGIPVTISTDPRSHFDHVLGAAVEAGSFSQWPDPIGFGALNDAAVTRRFADIVRQEYLAVGIRESLAPQADLATEPRWARINGTFGEDPAIVRNMVEAYVEGIQNGRAGLNAGSVAAVVKHWAGYGAARDGWDSHNFYGRFAVYPGHNFAMHLEPFRGAFAAHVASVMPTYSIPLGAEYHGRRLPEVGAGFDRFLLTDVLRGDFGFRGAVVSDWGITEDCNADCRNGMPPGKTPGKNEIGMPWGEIDTPRAVRFARTIQAGVDQIGGVEDSALVAADVRDKLLSEARVREAAARILEQKFAMGLFEQPYVDAAAAGSIVGNPQFRAEGMAAQAAATVLLKNEAPPGDTRSLLPLKPGTRAYLWGISPAAASEAGIAAVKDPAAAQVAVLHVPAPFHGEHPGYFFGSRQHEGRLYFTKDDEGYRVLLNLPPGLPIVFVTTLERPLILIDIATRVTALLGDFGIEDRPLLSVLTGKAAPLGKLPFELPGSEAAVEKQASDVPHDSGHPLFPIGWGLRYP